MRFVLSTLLIVTYCLTALAQDFAPRPGIPDGIMGFLASGLPNEYPTEPVYFSTPVTPQMHAVTIGQGVALAANPLTSGWVHLLHGEQELTLSNGGFQPAQTFDLLHTPLVIFGGQMGIIPDVFETLQIPSRGQQDSASTGLGSFAPTTPAIDLKLSEFMNDSGSSTVAISLTSAELDIFESRSIEVPEGGWWVLGMISGISPPDYDMDPNDDFGPVTDPIPWPMMPIPQLVPEPGSLMLAGLGITGLGIWCKRSRLRKGYLAAFWK